MRAVGWDPLKDFNDDLFFWRYDVSLVNLMNWYEAIFGDDIWKYLAIEISFWGHTEKEAEKRMSTRKVLDFNYWLLLLLEQFFKVSY